MMAKRLPTRGRQAGLFVAACESGSPAAAARKLGIEHRTALRLVKELECELDEELFLRMKQGVLPTAADTVLYRALTETPSAGAGESEEKAWRA